jgi:hypothetical protein
MTPDDLGTPTSLRRAEGVLARWTRMGASLPALHGAGSAAEPVPSLEPMAVLAQHA